MDRQTIASSCVNKFQEDESFDSDELEEVKDIVDMFDDEVYEDSCYYGPEYKFGDSYLEFLDSLD